MFDSTAKLLQKIRLGEDSFLACKAMVFADEAELADDLAALANAHGGVVVLGVEGSTREVVGIAPEELGLAEQSVLGVARDGIEPPLDPAIRRVNVSGRDGRPRTVLRVEVARSLFVHRSPGGYLYRVGSRNRVMDPDYPPRPFPGCNQTRHIRFDEQVVPDARIEDLDPALVDRFRPPGTRDDRPSLLRKLGMAAEDERGELRPSVAGLLLGSHGPEQRLRHAFIQAVAYRGETVADGDESGGYPLDARGIGGPLDAQVREACRFVLRNQRVAARKTVGRTDLPDYDITAVFEAVVNTVAHRDYSMHGSKIRLRMFSNRLELYSPGAISNTMTVEALAYRQSTRNQALTSLLARCPVPGDIAGLETRRATMMDRRGEGVSLILERSERVSGKRPVYDLLDESERRLTIFAASAGEGQGEREL